MNQKEFETKSHTDAIDKLTRQVKEAQQKAYFSSTVQARTTIKEYLLPTGEQLIEYYSEILKGRACTTASASIAVEMLEWIEHLDKDVIAAILLKTIFDIHGIFDTLTPAKFASQLGTRIEDEARFRYYETEAPEDVVAAMKRRVQEAGSSPKYRRISTKIITEKMMTAHGLEDKLWNKWSDHYRCTVGLSLLDFAVSRNLLVKEMKQGAKRRTTFVDLHPNLKKLQQKIFDKICAQSYLAYPLIEPPKPWELQEGPSINNTTGGYHTDWFRDTRPMCRGYHYQSEFGLPSVEFLNTCGNTAWVVDHHIYQLAKSVLDQHKSVGSLHGFRDDPRLNQPMPNHILALDKDDPLRKEWRHQMKVLHENQRKDNQRAIRSIQSVNLAGEFLKQQQFFLSWSNDYRGRCYTMQPWLSPHSTDSEKSLLRFAEGCKLDKRGEWWAAQAVGATYLGSRLNFQDRIAWTYSCKDLITSVATDPLATIDIWSKAKDPWQFLQLAIEWHKVVLTGQEHLWHVPVGADATASGLQLLSGILRDKKGMKFSNVLPPEDPTAPPEDSYLEVLALAKEMASKGITDAGGKYHETKHLIPHMRFRNIGKTTMVMLYGASFVTVRDKVIEVMSSEDIYPDTLSKYDCGLIAMLVIAASRKVFPKGFAALDWLTKLAKAAVKNGATELSWTTPSGDLIKLSEFHSKTQAIRTTHLGKVSLAYERGEPDLKAIVSAFSPGYVHSLDSALLKIAFKGWTQPIAPIHDCIKCLPSDMDAALDRIRRAFHTVCQGDPLDKLANDLGVTKDQLPRLKQGKGDISKVLDSVYLFN